MPRDRDITMLKEGELYAAVNVIGWSPHKAHNRKIVAVEEHPTLVGLVCEECEEVLIVFHETKAKLWDTMFVGHGALMKMIACIDERPI